MYIETGFQLNAHETVNHGYDFSFMHEIYKLIYTCIL